MAVPDYANMEATSRITTSGGTWTVDRNGYVRCGSVTTGTTQSGIQILINDKLMTLHYIVGSTQVDNGYLLPVMKGDIVQINGINNTNSVNCYFIPPRFAKLSAPVVSDTEYRNIFSSPDDQKKDNTNLAAGFSLTASIAAGNTSEWVSGTFGNYTVQKSGYYELGLHAQTSPIGCNMYMYVNNVLRFVHTISAGQMLQMQQVTELLKGDVIRFAFAWYRDANNPITMTLTAAEIKYIPPKFAEIAGASTTTDLGYSLAEQDTGTTWIDGKKIYKRTFTVMSPSAINTTLQTPLYAAGVVSTPIKQEVIMPHSTAAISVGNPHINSTDLVECAVTVVKASGGELNCAVRLPSTSGASWISKTFYVTVYYTKV
jgi:hypothetical protein